MRHFLSRGIPNFDRVLLVESGARQLFEDLLRGLYDVHPNMRADLLTCYAGVPEHYRTDRGSVYRVGDYRGSKARKKLYSELKASGYTVIGIICAAQPIMNRWKWMIAAHVPAKMFILNENGDYFWVDRGHLGVIRRFILFRAGLSGSGAVRTLARLVAFPFVLLYLILFAATVHLRRKLRTL